jgi:hypothetical protein
MQNQLRFFISSDLGQQVPQHDVWLKNITDFVQKQKKECPFSAVSAQRTTVLIDFWLFPPSGPLWILKMDHCVLERREKHFSRLICGVYYPIPG